MKIMLSGAAGFIGSHTALMLEERRHKVLAVDNLSTGRLENLSGFRGSFHLCDIGDITRLAQAFEDFRPDVVIHLAAQSAITTAFENPQLDLLVNGIGTINLVRLACEYDVKRFVFSSTSAVYDEKTSFFNSRLSEKSPTEPNTPYGISKLAAEKYIRLFFQDHVILRFGNVYGPRQQPIGQNQVIARALRHFMLGDEFKIFGDGEQKRDFVYVRDVAMAACLAATNPDAGTFNIASGKSYSVNQVLSHLEEIFDVRGYKWEHAGNNDPRRKVEMNVSAAENHLQWESTTSLKEGLRMTAQWWRDGVVWK